MEKDTQKKGMNQDRPIAEKNRSEENKGEDKPQKKDDNVRSYQFGQGGAQTNQGSNSGPTNRNFEGRDQQQQNDTKGSRSELDRRQTEEGVEGVTRKAS